MIEMEIRKFLYGSECAVGLVDFEPHGGYEQFLKKFCEYIDEEFISWYQGVESGLGHIKYKGYKLRIYWTDFPFALSFDCRDQAMAEELKAKLEAYFAQS